MKYVAAILVLVTMGAITLGGQSSGSSIAFSTSGTCQVPAAGLVILCGDKVKGTTQSIDNGPYASIVGAAGKDGLPGIAGKDGAPGKDSTVPGPIGPQGPPGIIPTKICGALTGGNGGQVVLTTAPCL